MPVKAFDFWIDYGLGLFNEGNFLSEIALYDAMLEYSLQPDQLAYIYSMQGEDFEKLGHYDLAIESYLKILDLGIRKPTVLNGLCWDFAITNRAQDALPFCDEAVKQDASANILDSRGVVFAMLGRYPEAQNDLEAALNLEDFRDDLRAQRQEWVTMLKSGKNSITPGVLEQERNEELPLAVDPEYTGDLKLSYLRSQYEEGGFIFEETTIAGQEGLIGQFENSKCMAEIVLLGNRKGNLRVGTSTILNCDHTDTAKHLREFYSPFCKDIKELYRAMVWQVADVSYVIYAIEDKEVSDLTPTFGSFMFKVERTNVGDSEGIIVTAMLAQ